MISSLNKSKKAYEKSKSHSTILKKLVIGDQIFKIKVLFTTAFRSEKINASIYFEYQNNITKKNESTLFCCCRTFEEFEEAYKYAKQISENIKVE